MPDSASNTPIRVLHIFAPNYKHRFGGPIFDWKFAFSRWNDVTIKHLVLDSEQGKILPAREAFNFPISSRQYIAARSERFRWIFRLLSLLIKHRREYDILHLHVPWWGGLLMGVWADLRGIPALYQSVLLNEDTPGGLLKERFGRFQVWCLRRFKAILCIADTLANDYLDHGFTTRQVFTLMNPVDTGIFHPVNQPSEKITCRQKFGLNPEQKVLLFVGSLIQRKGVDVLVDAFIEAKKNDPSLHLMLAGACQLSENPSLDMSFIEAIKNRILSSGNSDSVTFLGLIQNREYLADLYRAADVFIFPSRNEGLGNVVLEAMASGLPVVVSRLPVLQSVLTDGENGLFVPLDDSAALAKTINSLWYDWEKIVTLGQHAAEYVRSHHHFDQWQDEMSGFYRRLLRSTGRAEE